MTVFDLIAFGVVIWSALAGSRHGAVAELMGLFAAALAAMATIAALPATAAIARHILHAGWLSAVAAAGASFVGVFLFLRLLAGALTRAIDNSVLGGANRFGGLVFGALRGVVFLALFALVFNKATPEGMKPGWITDAAAYPLASDAGSALQTLLPKRFDLTGGFANRLTQSISDQSAEPNEETPAGETAPAGEPAVSDAQAPAAPETRRDLPSSERAKPAHNGYTKHARDSVDALVERSK